MTGRAPTILVVDDDEDVLDTAISAVIALGFGAAMANGAEMALDILREKRPIDLLFTDVAMPGMSGFQLAQQARALRPRLRVLYTTGFAERVSMPRDAVPGDIIRKPWRLDDLDAAFRRALGW